MENEQIRYHVPFFQVPDELIEDPRTSVYHVAVFCCLAKHAGKERRAWPSYSRISKLCKCSRRKAIDTVEELKSFGWITVERRRVDNESSTSNVYTLAPSLQGGAPRAPGVVHDMHQGGAPRAPEPYSENHTHSEPDLAIKPLSPMKDSLADFYQCRITEVFPATGWGNVARERKSLHNIAVRTRSLLVLTPYDDERQLALAILEQFAAMKRSGKSEYWTGVAFVPSKIDSRWSDIVAGLSQRFEYEQRQAAGMAAVERIEQ